MEEDREEVTGQPDGGDEDGGEDFHTSVGGFVRASRGVAGAAAASRRSGTRVRERPIRSQRCGGRAGQLQVDSDPRGSDPRTELGNALTSSAEWKRVKGFGGLKGPCCGPAQAPPTPRPRRRSGSFRKASAVMAAHSLKNQQQNF